MPAPYRQHRNGKVMTRPARRWRYGRMAEFLVLRRGHCLFSGEGNDFYRQQVVTPFQVLFPVVRERVVDGR